METYLWHEQPSYKNLFETEVDILKRGLNGDFKLFKDPFIEDSRLTAFGELTFGDNKKQQIKIVFPTKYPYAPPTVFAIKADYNESGIVMESITPVLFNKGNQYSDASLCLFRRNYWNSAEHNIGWLIRRAQKWLKSATSPEGFKAEEIVNEIISFLPHQGQVLLPKTILLPEGQKTGMFVLTQFKKNHFILEHNILPDSTFSNNVNNELFKWYSFERGITLKSLFQEFNVQNFVNAFLKYFGEKILEGERNKNIALHFPDDENPWHFFKLNIQTIGISHNISIQYFIVHTINNELYLRSKEIFDDQILQKKTATIIGLGALGSELAKSLAKNGIGHFNLFDLDTFEIGNSIRHAADLFFIGETKVSVTKQLILRSNPNITVNAYRTDVLNDIGLLERSLKESDICICLTAEDSVDYLINDHYVKKYKIPFIFARVSAGAFSGAIQIVNPGSACLRCLSLHGLDTLPESRTKIKFEELKPEYGSCSEPPLPGSEIDAKEIALMVARLSMQSLLQNESSKYPILSHNQFYWHGPFGSTEKEPFTWEMKDISKHPACKLCQ